MIGQAQTGSGKTAAFGLPMIEHVDPSEPEVQALVLTPTRELCIQVTQALRAYAQRKGVDVVAVFGGAPIRSQQAQLRDGGQIVVGTVGRVLDLIQRALADPAQLSLRGPRRGRRDARPRLPGGRRADPHPHAQQPPDRALQRDDAAADPRAGRSLPLRPGHGEGQVGHPDRRQRRAVLRRREVRRQGRQARRRAARRAPRPGHRLHAHEDPLRPALPPPARSRPERQGAARRHVPGPARRRDARASRAAACRSSSRPTSRPAAWTSPPSPTSSTSTCRPAPTSTCTGSGARAASGAPGAPSPSSSRASSASSRPSSATSAPRSPRGPRARTPSPRRWPSARAATPSRTSRARATSRRPSSSRASAAPRASRSPTSSTP